MSEAFYIALMQLVARIGLNATITLLENRGASIEEAIAALRKAQSVSLEDIIKAEATKAALASPKPDGA